MLPNFIFPPDSPYRRLARTLDALPNGFPPADDESDLRLLAKIFTPEEADLAANLLPEPEPPASISQRLGRSPAEITALLKAMTVKGLIQMGKTSNGRLGFGLMPFVVGIYEDQISRIDAELARLFEDYYQKSFGKVLEVQPPLHRVIPVGESIDNTMEVHPYESVSALLDRMQSYGVQDCICRIQKALIGEPCQHPVDVCMVFSPTPGAFTGDTTIRALTKAEAQATLKRAADAGLVHCVSNNQSEFYYICNCCTCSCGILRGMAELGIANAVAHSSFASQVDEDLCAACGDCLSACSFNAIKVRTVAHVEEIRCVGCGLCVPVCPNGALSLAPRAEEEHPPLNRADWNATRQIAREKKI